MTDTVLLVDYENIGKVDLGAIPAGVWVPFFFGASQKSVPTEFLKAALKLGERFVPIDIEGQGKNALDFHIAFYLGEQLARAPDSSCVILSKDKGFDPLIKHLAKRGFSVRRANTIGEALGRAAAPPAAGGRQRSARRASGRRMPDRDSPGKGATGGEAADREASNAASREAPGRDAPGRDPASLRDNALSLLAGTQKLRRPRRRKGLLAVLHSHFSQRVPEAELQQLIDQMIAEGKLSETNGAITYHL
jgi:PIN domain